MKRLQREQAGRLNISTLLASPILGGDLLVNPAGRALRASDLPNLHVGDATVGEFIEFQWHSPTVISFRRRTSSYPDPGDRSFRVLCNLIVMCYPKVLLQHVPSDTLRERSRSQDRWRLKRLQDGLMLQRSTQSDTYADVGIVTTLRQAETLARRVSGRKRLQFQPHSSLSPVLPLWGSATRLAKKQLRRLLVDSRAPRVEEELAARSARAHEASPAFGTALDDVDWACPAAQQIWNHVREWWKRLGLWHDRGSATTRSFLQAIFSLRLPHTPPKVWEFAPLHQGRCKTDDPAADPFPVLQAAWQQVVLESLVFLQAWRANCSGDDQVWSSNQATVLHDAACQSILRVLGARLATNPDCSQHEAALVEELRERLGARLTIPPALTTEGPLAQSCDHLLFFDGVSRSSLETASSGAVIVAATKHVGVASIVWTSGIKHQTQTTSLQAAYKGLIAGLHAARSRKLARLEVVGHNALILKQLRDHRPPRAPALGGLYRQARKLADLIGVSKWTHHTRNHNKMARKLAKHSTVSSEKPSITHFNSQADIASLPNLLHNDLRSWWPSQSSPVDN